MNVNKLSAKLFIEGTIKIVTGLHIGGSKSSMIIGGVDLDIVKTGNGVPFIPGSSLKGKMRSLLAKVEGSNDIKNDSTLLKKLFGDPAAKDERHITRLQIRDAHLNKNEFDLQFGTIEDRVLDFDYSEIKTENVINRLKGSAEHPRHMERVPAGSIFDFKFDIDIYEGDNIEEFTSKIKLGLDLLNDDYLGGSGSRGSGGIDIIVTKINGKKYSDSGITAIEDGELESINEKFGL